MWELFFFFLILNFWTGFCQMMVKIIVRTVYLGDPDACVRWESTLLPWCFLTHWLVGWLVGGGVEAHSRCLLFFSSTWLSSLISSLKVHAAAALHVHVTANSLFFTLLRRRHAVSNFVDLPLTVKYVSCHWIFVSVIILCTKPLNDLVSVCFWRSLKRLLNFDLTLLFFYMH